MRNTITTTTATIAEIESTCTCIKASYMRGYVSRKTNGVAHAYNGRYGSGYAILRPTTVSTQYCVIEYWIAK